MNPEVGGRLIQGILIEKTFVHQNPHLPWAFTVRISSKIIYISSICNVRMMSDIIAVVRVPCMVRRTPVIIVRVTSHHDSLWQVHNFDQFAIYPVLCGEISTFLRWNIHGFIKPGSCVKIQVYLDLVWKIQAVVHMIIWYQWQRYLPNLDNFTYPLWHHNECSLRCHFLLVKQHISRIGQLYGALYLLWRIYQLCLLWNFRWT